MVRGVVDEGRCSGEKVRRDEMRWWRRALLSGWSSLSTELEDYKGTGVFDRRRSEKVVVSSSK